MPYEPTWDPKTLKRRMREHGNTIYNYTKNTIADALMRGRRNYGTMTEEKFIEP